MVKKLTVPCSFGNGQKIPVTLYVGNPALGSHPFDFQNRWLNSTKGGNIPEEIMKSFGDLNSLAAKNRVSFEELCGYVIEELNAHNDKIDDYLEEKTKLEKIKNQNNNDKK